MDDLTRQKRTELERDLLKMYMRDGNALHVPYIGWVRPGTIDGYHTIWTATLIVRPPWAPTSWYRQAESNPCRSSYSACRELTKAIKRLEEYARVDAEQTAAYEARRQTAEDRRLAAQLSGAS